MKTFKQFCEGIFDFLPKGNFETQDQAKQRAIKTDPKSVSTKPYVDPNKPPKPTEPRSREFQHGRKIKDILPGGTSV